MLPLTFENIFASAKSHTFIHTQNKNDSPNVERNSASTSAFYLSRENLFHCSFSENAEELILQSWRISTQAKYKTVLEQ